MKIVVQLTLDQDGKLDVQASTKDAAMIVLILEKAKLKALDGITLQPESLIIPRNGLKLNGN